MPTPSFNTQRHDTKEPTTFNFKKITPTEARREKGLCYRCGDKYTPDHICPKKELNFLEELEGNEDEYLMEEKDEENETGEANVMETEDETMQLSINALTGNVNCSTLRIKGRIKNREIVADRRACFFFFD